jgi:uncharacterized membrane protein YedE/YeeE
MKSKLLNPEPAGGGGGAAVAPETPAEPVSPYWSPYFVGASIGVLSWIIFAFVNQPLGVSTALSAAAGECAKPIFGAEAVAQNAYWSKFPFKWDYGMLFLVGIVLGSAFSVLASRTFRLEKVPAVWQERFGPSAWKRMAAAFFGGALLMYGARMAGGCTSGHGISGTMQLAVSSWLFTIVMFGAAITAVWLLFRESPEPRTGTQPQKTQPQPQAQPTPATAQKGVPL